MNRESKHILIVGGGYVGLYTGLRLQRRLRRELRDGSVRITLIDPQSYMTYQPFLPEAAAGNLSPRHVVVPLRRVLPKVRILNGTVTKVHHAAPDRHFAADAGPAREIGYDIIVMARRVDLPDAADPRPRRRRHRLQDHRRGDRPAQPRARPARHRRVHRRPRRRAAGRSPSSWSAAGSRASRRSPSWRTWPRDAIRYYRRHHARRTCAGCSSRRPTASCPRSARRWAGGPLEQLRERGIEIKMNTRLESCEDGIVGPPTATSSPAEHPRVDRRASSPARWSNAGDLPLDERGRVKATTRADRRRASPARSPRATWPACPTSPDPGEFCAPNAQHAVRQAKVLGDNIVRHLRGRALMPIPPQVRRLGRRSRPAPGRRQRLRHQAARLPGVVHAPHLPPVPGADVQPQGPRRRGLDAGAVLQAGDDLARRAAPAARGVQGRGAAGRRR